ncbi:MAG TPA: hypothetical protein VK631_21985 [Solirubrobacteraceae bacterium]|nr:hypothetical protein [Solirubrobacteraceae bacterium]
MTEEETTFTLPQGASGLLYVDASGQQQWVLSTSRPAWDGLPGDRLSRAVLYVLLGEVRLRIEEADK